MNFIAINPRTMSVEVVAADELTDVFEHVGLKKMEVDYGGLYRYESGATLSIVVYEAGLFKGPKGRYFSIGTHLYEGGAVIYAADERGDTISVNHKPPITFYRDIKQVESAIALGYVIRPHRAICGEVTWQWPEERDFHMNERETELMIKGLRGDEP